MKPTRKEIQAAARRYLKVIEWSNEDQCYIGSAPPIIGQACHGTTEGRVLEQLTGIVEEWVEIFLREGRPLPAPTAGKRYSGKFVVRVPPELHEKVALKAGSRNESLNQFVAAALENA